MRCAESGFNILDSRFRTAEGLTNLLMVLSTAEFIALSMALLVIKAQELSRFDWHRQRGLSFLQLGLRKIQSISYQGNRSFCFQSLPRINPPPACASKKKAKFLRYRIEFEKNNCISVIMFYYFSAPIRPLYSNNAQ